MCVIEEIIHRKVEILVIVQAVSTAVMTSVSVWCTSYVYIKVSVLYMSTDNLP